MLHRVHYPGTLSPQNAVQLGKPLWSSEDYSTVNDAVGGGCWARVCLSNSLSLSLSLSLSCKIKFPSSLSLSLSLSLLSRFFSSVFN